MSLTGLVKPFEFEALQVKIAVPGGCSIVRVMDVSVSVGFTPVQLLFGHPATAPLTVGAAVKVAGFVVKVRSGALRLGCAPRQRRDLRRVLDASGQEVEGRDLDSLLAAAVDATEEAVLNAMWAAPDVRGRDGRVVRGLPHEQVLEVLRGRAVL